jgi:hypothetical protein
VCLALFVAPERAPAVARHTGPSSSLLGAAPHGPAT